ncbi:MAG: hypothetical protein WAT79_13025, partial [Saprospiraceae bacterium]
MIKKFITLSVLFFLLSLSFKASAQLDSIKLVMVYDTTTCLYNVCFKVVGGSAVSITHRTQANAQVSLVIKATDSMEVVQRFFPLEANQFFTGTNPNNWGIGTQVFTPAAQPESNFYTFVPALSPAHQYNRIYTGDTVKLFSIRVWNKATGLPLLDCGETVRFFRNGVDPNSSAPGMLNGDFSNGFTVGSVRQLYAGNLERVGPRKPNLQFSRACSGDIELDLMPTTLTCQLPFTYDWTGPNFYGSNSEDILITPASSANNGTYSVTVTDAMECTSTIDIELERKPNAGVDIDLCGSGSVLLNASSDNPGTWVAYPMNPAGASLSGTIGTSANATFTGVTGDYMFIFESTVCNDTVNVSVKSSYSTSILGDNSFCSGGFVQLSTPGGVDFVWSTGETSSTIDVYSAGTYIVTVTDASGCSGTASKVITANPNPTADIAGDNAVCQGSNATFTASGGTNYVWSSSEGTSSITVTDNTPRTVTITDANGCTDTETKTLTIHSNPTADIAGDNAVCQGANATFTASGGTNYVWSSSEGTSSITVSDNTPRTVTVTDANGCTDTETKTLTINNSPTADIAGDNAVCQGANATFTASGGTNYVWSSSEGTSSITVSDNTPRTVTVTDANGCTDTETKTLTIHANPTADIA